MTTMAPLKPSQRARTKAGTIQKAPGNGVSKQDITAAKISASMTKRSDVVIRKLEEAFAIDSTVEEACLYADISPATYYTWVKEDPKLLERFTTLRHKPVLKARKSAVAKLDDSYANAMDYLKRKRPQEFGDKASGGIFIQNGVVVLPQRNNAPAPAEIVTTENTHGDS